MQIFLNPNINLFKNKTKSQILNLMPKYKKHFRPIFQKFISEIGIDIECINSISVVPYTKETPYGVTKHFIKDDKIYLDIVITDDILIYTKNVQDSTETFKSKSVIQHELFHCIEIKYLYESKVLSNSCPLDDDFVITTMYDFLYDESVKLWSEFYAVYNNRKINEWHEIPDIRVDIEEIHRWFLASRELALDKTTNDVKMCKDMFKSLHTFWYHLVSLVALHIQSGEDILIDDYLSSDIPYIKTYFQVIYDYLKANNTFYPTWLSEDNYIKLGKMLMAITRFYGLDFSTEDLSDNFVLKIVKNPRTVN